MNFLLTKCLSLQIPVQEKHDKTTMIWQELYFAWLLQPATYVASCFKQTNRRLLELPKMPLPLFVCACERLGARGSRGAFFFTIQVSLATKMRKKKASLLPRVSKLPILFRALSRSWFIWRACRGGGLRRYQSLWLVLSIKRSNLCKTDRAANPPR